MSRLQTNILGYPRVGAKRELKKVVEAYWAGKATAEELQQVARELRRGNWTRLQNEGIDFIPSNDFSYYDTVLDLTLSLGAIPERYESLKHDKLALYFAMARGRQTATEDVIAMEMTKWFDTNYHYTVPEFTADQTFSLFDTKAVREFEEAKALGIHTKPVLIGPVSYLLLGKEKEAGFSRLSLLDRLLPVYLELLQALEKAGATWVQIDEPFLALDLDDETRAAYRWVYERIAQATGLQLILTTYFEGLRENLETAVSLGTAALHIDLVRAPEQLEAVLKTLRPEQQLSLGIVEGRNIWKNDYEASLPLIQTAVAALGKARVWVGTSSSLLHVPYDLEQETRESVLTPEIKNWLAFAYQKTKEVSDLAALAVGVATPAQTEAYAANRAALQAKRTSALVHNPTVAARTAAIQAGDIDRQAPYAVRAKAQQASLGLPAFPTTTIGSFPQTKEVRAWRAQARKGELTPEAYQALLREETARCIQFQEEIDLDVLVHGEFERNDMVEYFGEQLQGFTFTQFGWVQSYGTRCVKPPVIFGDVHRPKPMTVDWSSYAQSLTTRPMKGMLTGPVTILKWSFVRNDQPLSLTTQQIALAIRDEVADLEAAGIKIIQIDEPAIREGLPLRRADWAAYLKWAVDAFRLSAAVVRNETQIHTHMCYSEFNDIIADIARMDADVITIECSRSQMELLDAFRNFHYPLEIGPGVYDIHTSRQPSVAEMVALLHKAAKLVDPRLLWVNPDCGLKTRAWDETRPALQRMVEAAKQVRQEISLA